HALPWDPTGSNTIQIRATDLRSTAPRSAAGPRMRPILFFMEMVVDQFRDRFRNAVDSRQIGNGGAAHGLGRAEMQQQGAFAGRPDAGDLVERVLRHFLLAPGTV